MTTMLSVLNESSYPDIDTTLIAGALNKAAADWAKPWNAHPPLASHYAGHAWTMKLVDEDKTAPGALAYHDDPNAVPDAVVMVKTILNYIGKTGPAGYYGPGGVLVGAVHEWLEMLGDIWCNGWSVNWDTGQVVAQEHCDPVENSDYAVTVPSHLGIATNVYVSNFVLPQWFNNGGPGPYDHLGHLSKPFQLERGGYCVVADISNESQVTQRTIKGVRQPFGVQVLGDVPTTHGYRTMRRFGLTSAEEAALRELAA